MHPIVSISCLLGLILPLIILYYNKGYLSANRYLACFLFFISLYVLEDFVFFYSKISSRIAFATTTHSFFYLIGPFAFFYIRSILRDRSDLSEGDYLHFLFYVVSFIGYFPYFLTSWDYKLLVAQNIMSDHWDISQFHLNLFIPHKLDQILNVLHSYFYVSWLWFLVFYYRKRTNLFTVQTNQYKLIRNWVVVFVSIYTITTLNFTVAIANNWLYDDKSVFLERANEALIFASIIYIAMNMIVMFFPHIMYGLPIDMTLDGTSSKLSKTKAVYINKQEALIFSVQDHDLTNTVKTELQLFTPKYIDSIKSSLDNCIESKVYLNIDFKLLVLSKELGIPAHHLTYFFNEIVKVSFSEWRNGLRITYAKELLNEGVANMITLQALSLQCGFSSQSTFIRAFKNVTGNPPSYYMKSIKVQSSNEVI